MSVRMAMSNRWLARSPSGWLDDLVGATLDPAIHQALISVIVRLRRTGRPASCQRRRNYAQRCSSAGDSITPSACSMRSASAATMSAMLDGPQVERRDRRQHGCPSLCQRDQIAQMDDRERRLTRHDNQPAPLLQRDVRGAMEQVRPGAAGQCADGRHAARNDEHAAHRIASARDRRRDILRPVHGHVALGRPAGGGVPKALLHLVVPHQLAVVAAHDLESLAPAQQRLGRRVGEHGARRPRKSPRSDWGAAPRCQATHTPAMVNTSAVIAT